MKLLLIQCRTDASAPHEHNCVTTHSGLDPDRISVVNPVTHPGSLAAKKIHDYDAVIIGGSGEFGLSHREDFEDALNEIRPFLDDLLKHDHPFLGMCLGHQILAWHLGARVVADKNQEEVGSFYVSVLENGLIDPIFRELPSRFIAQHGHQDSVTELPRGSVHLSRGERNEVGGFRVGERVYGLQFHPELTLDDLMTRLALYPEYLRGRTLAEARQDFLESPEAPKVLKNFFGQVATTNVRSPETLAELVSQEVSC